ncbi:hypothetical protein O53_547 [Microcystis aeruginosa TAIHU98]|uniref:Uncharacterized protein n=1 Tax=Microcystis aeruginosa TAIHU98 TaxID=1134457 RepID=L7EB92_MICAE|nr:hypothetical protein O53_547 [Microcystis aeruginosa TAIHU98]
MLIAKVGCSRLNFCSQTLENWYKVKVISSERRELIAPVIE